MATITISAIGVENWTFGGSVATLRIYALNDFISSGGNVILQGNTSTENCYKTVNCTVSSTTLTVPSFTIDSTNDSSQPNAAYIAFLFDTDGIKRNLWLDGAFEVPSLPTTTSWTAIAAYNRARPIVRRSSETYDTDQINLLLSQLSLAPLADDAIYGRARLSVAAANVLQPIVVGDNDTRLEASLAQYGNSLATAISSLGSTETLLNITAATTVSTAVTVPANIIIRQRNRALITKSGSGTITFAGIGLDRPDAQIGLFSGFAAGDVTWSSSTAYPKEISTELWDTGNTSLTERVARADAAFTGKAVKILASPRTITEHVTITDDHHLHFLPGTYPNTKSNWASGGATEYLPAFTFQDNVTISGDNATIQLPNNDNNPNLFYGYNSRYGGNSGIQENVTIKDLKIVGTGGTNSAGSHSIIFSGNTYNFRCENIHFEAAYGYPIVIGGSSAAGYCADGVIVTNISMVETGTQLISVINGRNVLIDNYTLDLRNHTSSSTFTAIDLEPNSVDDVLENITVSNGSINGDVAGNPSVYFSGITVNTALASQANNINLVNNLISGRQISQSTASEGALLYGIAIEGGFDVTVDGNDIRGTGQVGIQASLSRYLNIRNNSCLQLRGSYGMQLLACANADVISNSLTESYTPFGVQSSNITESELEFLVTTSGTVATRTSTSGTPRFFTGWDGLLMTINGANYTISSINHETQAITFTSSIGTLTVKSVASATDVNTGTDFITSTAHGFNNGCRLRYTAGTAAIAGLTTGTTYFVVNKTNDTFQLAATEGGSAINLTSTGTGTQTFTPVLLSKFSSNKYVDNDAVDGYVLSSTGTSQISATALDGIITEVADVAHTAASSAGVIVYTSLTTGRTVTLPTAVGLKGKIITIKDGAGTAATNNITLDGNGSETIDGASTYVIRNNYGFVRIKSNGTNWIVVNSSVIAGTTGTTDNALTRADGTGGGTLQSTGITVNDGNVLTFPDASVAAILINLFTNYSLGIGSSTMLFNVPTGSSYQMLVNSAETMRLNETICFVAVSPAQITANQDNYNPGRHRLLRLNSDASRNITGIANTQTAGQTHLLINVGSTDIVLKHQDAASTAANRLLNSTGADITLTANQAADLIYDGTTARWRVFKRN